MLVGEQKREYNRKWIAARRAQYLQKAVCVLCGSIHRLEVDHIDPKTKVDHHIWSWAIPRLEKELEKCQILCRDCHQQKTSMENQRPLVHGNSGYGRFCRCDVCKHAHSQRMKTRIRKTAP